MTIELFIFLLAFFSAVTSLITEGIKKTFLVNTETYVYKITAIVVAIVVGVVGMFAYYTLNSIGIDLNNVIFAILMGFASGLVAMNGYDAVHDVLKMLKG